MGVCTTADCEAAVELIKYAATEPGANEMAGAWDACDLCSGSIVIVVVVIGWLGAVGMGAFVAAGCGGTGGGTGIAGGGGPRTSTPAGSTRTLVFGYAAWWCSTLATVASAAGERGRDAASCSPEAKATPLPRRLLVGERKDRPEEPPELKPLRPVERSMATRERLCKWRATDRQTAAATGQLARPKPTSHKISHECSKKREYLQMKRPRT